jgi:hypothetical protein
VCDIRKNPERAGQHQILNGGIARAQPVHQRIGQRRYRNGNREHGEARRQRVEFLDHGGETYQQDGGGEQRLPSARMQRVCQQRQDRQHAEEKRYRNSDFLLVEQPVAKTRHRERNDQLARNAVEEERKPECDYGGAIHLVLLSLAADNP